jgi:hypothetical protein
MAEFGEDLRWVITDGRNSEAFRAKFIYSSLQLDQLRFAIGSPVSGTVENQHHAVRTHDGIKGPGLAVLVLQIEIRHSLADLRAKLRHVHGSSSPLNEGKSKTLLRTATEIKLDCMSFTFY